MKPISASRSVAGLLLLTLLAGVPVVVFRKALFQTRSRATLVLNANDVNDVALGHDIPVVVENVPDGWSGAISVNSAQRFPFRSTPFRLKATVENGFKRHGINDLAVVLLDQNGAALPIKGSDGHYHIATVPNVTVHPELQVVDAEPTSRAIIVEEKVGYRSGVSGRPEWVTIRPRPGGIYDGKIHYDVQRNTSNEPRSAQFLIGDAIFEIQQRAPVAVQLPYRESFSSRVPPSPIWLLDKRDHGERIEAESRWFLDEQPGRQSTVTVEPGGPGGSNSLIIQNSQADSRPWATQLDLPEIEVETGARYVVSVFLKAEVPGSVTINFTQRTAPYQDCGLFQTVAVTKDWTEVTLPFRVSSENCGAKKNRLAIWTGTLAGKLWIANVSLGLSPTAVKKPAVR